MFKYVIAVLALFFASFSFAAVDVNSASAADLDSIKGVGPKMSQRILDERAKDKFKDWGDLIARVKGINTKTAARLSAGGLTVNGSAFDGATAAATPKTGVKHATSAASASTPALKK